MTKLILILNVFVPLAVGAFALRHLRRVARPEEPTDSLPPLLVLAGKAFVLQFALGLLLVPFVLVTRSALNPWLSRQGDLLIFTQPWAAAVWIGVQVLLLAAVTIPFFVSVASAALDLGSPGPLSVRSAGRVALRGRYFRYWAMTWLVWLLVGVVRLVVVRALGVPLSAGGFNAPAEVTEAIAYAVRIPVMAHFIGLWAREALREPVTVDGEESAWASSSTR